MIQTQALVKKLKPLKPEKIILFGSYAKGESTSESDIDLLIIKRTNCYATQQVAEKALKALILANGKVIPKIHSLDRLLSFLKELKVDTKEVEEASRELDKYYITSRYPGQYGGPEGLYDKSDAESAIASAEKILSFAKEQINQYSKVNFPSKTFLGEA